MWKWCIIYNDKQEMSVLSSSGVIFFTFYGNFVCALENGSIWYSLIRCFNKNLMYPLKMKAFGSLWLSVLIEVFFLVSEEKVLIEV